MLHNYMCELLLYYQQPHLLTMSVTRAQVLGLYRRLLREGARFPNYNYRKYTARKVRDCFKQNKVLSDPVMVTQSYHHGLNSLKLIERQVTIGQMYTHSKLVVEQ